VRAAIEQGGWLDIRSTRVICGWAGGALLERFSKVWCDSRDAIQPLVVAEMPADTNNDNARGYDHAAADILCNACRSVIATLHAERAQ
jgi:hypothetical protein